MELHRFFITVHWSGKSALEGEKKESLMKKNILIITLLVIGLLLAFTGCKKAPEDVFIDQPVIENPGGNPGTENPIINPVSPNLPLRAVTSAPLGDPSRVSVLAYHTDGTRNYYLIDGGIIEDVHIGTMQFVHYNGITPISSSARTITQSTITQSLSETISSSYRFEESHRAYANASAGYKGLFTRVSGNAGWEGSWNRTTFNEKSTETFFESAITNSNENSIAFTVGNHGEPAGWYRKSQYAKADIFFYIVTSLNNQELLEWEAAICIRPGSYFPYFEYSANNNFDNSPVNLLSLPVDFWKTLPILETNTGNNDAGNNNKRIGAGISHSVAIDADGNLWAWGIHDRGRLGNDDLPAGNKLKPERVKTNSKFIAVSVGGRHNLAIDTDGNLWAWGENNSGQLGDGTTRNRGNPVIIREGTKFIAISAGQLPGDTTNSHSLAIDANGNLWAWGRNNHGQLGIGNTSDFHHPQPVKTGTKFKSISAGVAFSFAIDENDNLWAWGRNNTGQLGDGSTTQRTTPVQIKPGTKFMKVSGGLDDAGTNERFHSLAIDADGNLWAWGNNSYGQIGDGSTTQRTTPVQIKPGTKFKAIEAGCYSSYAIDTQNNLWVWGRNNERQLGTGNTTQYTTPVLSNRNDLVFTEISGSRHALAMDWNGNIWSWGRNEGGQLGIGSTTNMSIPTRVNFP